MPSWTQQILAEKQGDNVACRRSETRKQRVRAAVRPAFVDSPEVDSLDSIDFGSRLMSISELARASGIGQKLLRRLVRDGKLRPIRVPGGQRLKYSPQILAEIIKRENQSFY